jgi:TonB family protein
MARLDFVSNLRTGRNPGRGRLALLASLVLHGAAFGSVLAVAILCRMNLPLLQTGSAPGEIILSLEKKIIVPAPTPPPLPVEVTARHDPPAPAQPPKLELPPAPPPEGLAVLPPEPPMPAKTSSPKMIKTASSPSSLEKKHQAAAKPAVASAPPSSYAPGREDLPHPPYPIEARDGHKTGTVLVNIQFDAQGSVARARVWRSSGVVLLDDETMSFIRANWHSSIHAGQTINVPVEYKLQPL